MTLLYSILNIASVTNVKASPVCGGYTLFNSSVSSEFIEGHNLGQVLT